MSTPWKKQDVFKLTVTVLITCLTVLLFIPFYSQILLAAVFAFAIQPKLSRLLHNRTLRWKTSVAGILGLFCLLIVGPVTLVGYKTYAYFVAMSKVGFQNTDLFRTLSILRAQLLKYFNDTLHSFHLDGQLDLSGISEDAITRIGTVFMDLSTKFIYHIPDAILFIFVFNLALYFFLAEAQAIKSAFLKTRFLSLDDSQKLINILQKSSFNTVITSISLGGIAAGVVALGAVFLEGGDFTVVFVVTFICSFIPIIGAGPVALVLGLYKLAVGSAGQALGFLIVAGIVGFVDNGLRPYLISSNDEDIHPVVSLLALIGALLIFGMPGIFLGPVIAGSAFKVYAVFYPEPSPPTEVVSSQ